MSTVSVGFSPVTPGNSVISGGVAASAAAAPGEGDSPLGFFAALLDTLAQGLGVTPPAGTAVKSDTTSANTPGGDTAASTLADLAAAVATAADAEPGVTLAAPAATGSDAPATDLPKDAERLFSSLISSLTAIDDAARSGKPIDPALRKKLDDTLDELAGMLGIVLPTAPAVDPAITAAATTGGAAPTTPAPDPLVEIAKAAIPAAVVPQDSTPESELLDGLADEFLKAADKASAPAPVDPRQTAEANRTPATAATATSATTAPATEAAPIAPASPLGQLISKIQGIAENLQAAAPELGAKLAAVAEKLSTQPIDAKTLAQLNADLDSPDLAALLTPKPESKPASTGTQVFTTPSLATPETVTQPAQAAEAKVPETRATPASGTDDATETKAVETKPVAVSDSRPDVEPKAIDRSGVAHANEVRAERAAEAAQNQTSQVAATAQAKSEAAPLVAKAAPIAYQPPAQQQVNLPHLAFEFARQFNQGSSRFQIRLDPAELGRIDVRMHMDGDGNMLARMTVERAETLDLMQRDQRSLEKALAQAGLDSSKTTLEFSLRQNPSGRDGQNPQQQGGNGSPFAQTRSGADEVPEIIPNATLYRGTASASGVNLFV